MESCIAGYDWVAAEIIRRGRRPSVCNLSLIGGASDAADAALQKVMDAGCVVVAAAGNTGDDSCLYSPARMPAAITVAASTQGDSYATWSHRGTCVDIQAPGQDVRSLHGDLSQPFNTVSGTSIAAPHVAGAVALLLAERFVQNAADIQTWLRNAARPVLSNVPTNTPNGLLYIGDIIPQLYIVIFKQGIQKPAIDDHIGRVRASLSTQYPNINWAAVLKRNFTSAVSGYSAWFPPPFVKILSSFSEVSIVEQDDAIEMYQSVSSVAGNWGLPRINNLRGNLDPSLLQNYVQPQGQGAGVDIYVFDGAINTRHYDFGGRARSGFNASQGGDGSRDHGTAAASIAASNSFGVAKMANIISVRVFDDALPFASGAGGTIEVAIAAFDWAHRAVSGSGRPSVCLITFGSSASASLDAAAAALVSSGCATIAAAGNRGVDACNISPARVPSIVTVAAADKQDQLARNSNFGSCVKLMAPGTDLWAAFGDPRYMWSVSGTSYSAAFAAGAAALIMSQKYALTPNAVTNFLTRTALSSPLMQQGTSRGTPNAYLYTGNMIQDLRIVKLRSNTTVSGMLDHLNILSGLIRTVIPGYSDNPVRQIWINARAYSTVLPVIIAPALAGLPEVEAVELNASFDLYQSSSQLVQQQNTDNWGLARIMLQRADQTALRTYNYPSSAGQNVTIYFIDGGANMQHKDFGGRLAGSNSTTTMFGALDHGTAVASVAMSAPFGVAKAAQGVIVRAFQPNVQGNTVGVGTKDTILTGIDWIIGNLATLSGRNAVCVCGFGGQPSPVIDSAVRALIAAGCATFVAAGNARQDACNVSPARVQEAITVASADSTDRFSGTSNFGPCVDIIAPGENLWGSWPNSDFMSKFSGTSYASAIAAGAAALIYSEKRASNPGQITSFMINNAVQGVVGNVPTNTPNRYLFLGSLLPTSRVKFVRFKKSL
ncbi:peptidase S8/S53 domain-containing protein [Cladochytrium replicatum]|nr:peptidase S8/S53 domain-containing protein [Cladochytrium replicatum]